MNHLTLLITRQNYIFAIEIHRILLVIEFKKKLQVEKTKQYFDN